MPETTLTGDYGVLIDSNTVVVAIRPGRAAMDAALDALLWANDHLND